MTRCLVTLFVLAIGLSASPASALSLVDNFNDNNLLPNWQVVGQSGGAWANESNGKLNVGGTAGQKGELWVRHSQAIGDQGSVQIDYDWRAYSGHKARVGLELRDASMQNGIRIKGVRYRSGSHAVDGHMILDGAHSSYDIAYSIPTVGKLRIERNGNNLRTLYLNNGSWQVLLDLQHDFGSMALYPHVFTSNSDTFPSWHVAMDNFNYEYTVPEPATMSLLALGGLAALKRRRK